MSATTASSDIRQDIARIFALQQKNAPALGLSRVNERIKKLKDFRAALNDPAWFNALAEAMHRDFRKHPVEAYASEVGTTTSYIDHICKNLSRWLSPRREITPLPLLGITSYVQCESKGQVLIISPWNYPVLLAFCPLVNAIAAGNAVMVKPSEMTPNTSAFIRSFLSKLFDEKEVAVVEGDAETATALLELPFDHIHFTGSPAVGKIIMSAAARNLTSITLELGGKSPAIVTPSADIALTAQKMAWAKHFNNGQTCIAPDYAVIHESVLGSFIQHYEKALNRYFNSDGKGIQQSDSLPRIINLKHFRRIRSLLEDALDKGAKVAVGGQSDEQDLYIAPSLIVNADESMKIMAEEIFGPLLPVITYREASEIPAVIARRPKPLALYIAGKKRKEIRYLLQHSTAGSTIINDYLLGFSNPHLPMGGVNNSGMGRSLGFAGFREFCNERSVMDRRFLFSGLKLVFPPYGKRANLVLRWLYRLINY
ncbi:MAG TPA: aldehyde dehydrogenase family protein [Flavilitoribacter sp.]|nr:aldehyde dehydrogenase family protein [Flavilitoribacter sp.]